MIQVLIVVTLLEMIGNITEFTSNYVILVIVYAKKNLMVCGQLDGLVCNFLATHEICDFAY